jgi:hypothetical protein
MPAKSDFRKVRVQSKKPVAGVKPESAYVYTTDNQATMRNEWATWVSANEFDVRDERLQKHTASLERLGSRISHTGRRNGKSD